MNNYFFESAQHDFDTFHENIMTWCNSENPTKEALETLVFDFMQVLVKHVAENGSEFVPHLHTERHDYSKYVKYQKLQAYLNKNTYRC